MKKFLSLCAFAVVCVLLPASQAVGQSNERKFEVGAQFTTLRMELEGSITERGRGGGGRVAYNFSKFFSAESEINFLFPKHNSQRLRNERLIQALFGFKGGIRGSRVGVFGKVRPGFIYLSEFNSPNFGGTPSLTRGALDVGGVVEFYPSSRIITRLDLGDTMISRFNRHGLQVSTGIGFRF